jgi:serine/threonine-protein kinase
MAFARNVRAMVQQRIGAPGSPGKTIKLNPAPAAVTSGPSVTDVDDDAETEALRRFTPVRTAVIRQPDPAKPESGRARAFYVDEPYVDEPTEAQPREKRAPAMSMVDAGERPVDASGFDQRYEQITVLGTGGMGEVRLCKDRLIGRSVAMKVMHDELAVQPELRERFLREVRIQGQLEHPAIVPVYDLGVDSKGGIIFTMKRIRGMTLDTVLDGIRAGNAELTAKYSRRKLLTAFGSVCLAVDFAHERGVIHRDIKPENIILGDFGEVYILDWGIAKVTSASDVADAEAIELTQDSMQETALGSLLGTPGYMSPEQAVGAIDRLDARTDVYALGAILFEIIAGQTLHDAALPVQKLLSATIRGVDARPSARGARDVPPELDAICVQATAPDPANRYSSARALYDAIERFLDGDRNEELRRDLSKRHSAAARETLSRAENGDGDAQAARSVALREIGSALALNPSNVEALRTMARLLMDVPEEVPPEAAAELQAVSANARRDAARGAANRFLMWLAFLPLALWMGIRHIPSTAVAVVAMLICGGTAFWMAQRSVVDRRHGLALLLLSSVTLGLMSALFGPFILVPGLVATNTMFFAMNADRQARGVVIAAGVMAIVLPFILEVSGVLPPAYAFSGDILQVLPRATEFPAMQTMLCLLLTSTAMVVIPGLLMGRMRDALTTAERRLVLQAWHLRQLVPGGGGGLSPKKTLMPRPEVSG